MDNDVANEINSLVKDETIKIAEYMTNKFGESVCLFKEKNVCYGNSFLRSARRYGIKSVISRLYDKFNRLESLTVFNVENKQDDESIEDTLIDLANYCMMLAYEFNLHKDKNNKVIDNVVLDSDVLKKCEEDIQKYFVMTIINDKIVFSQRYNELYFEYDESFLNSTQKSVRKIICEFLTCKANIPLGVIIEYESKYSNHTQDHLLRNILLFIDKYKYNTINEDNYKKDCVDDDEYVEECDL